MAARQFDGQCAAERQPGHVRPFEAEFGDESGEIVGVARHTGRLSGHVPSHAEFHAPHQIVDRSGRSVGDVERWQATIWSREQPSVRPRAAQLGWHLGVGAAGHELVDPRQGWHGHLAGAAARCPLSRVRMSRWTQVPMGSASWRDGATPTPVRRRAVPVVGSEPGGPRHCACRPGGAMVYVRSTQIPLAMMKSQ